MNSRDLFWLGTGIAVGVAVGVYFPRIRREFGPIIREASERANSVASEFATVVSEQIQRSYEQARQPDSERMAS